MSDSRGDLIGQAAKAMCSELVKQSEPYGWLYVEASSVDDVLIDGRVNMLDVARVALAAHDAEKRAEWEAERGEVEWEYGVGWEMDWHPVIKVAGFRMESRDAAEAHLRKIAESDEYDEPHFLVRRLPERVAGPWVPVTEIESEDRA